MASNTDGLRQRTANGHSNGKPNKVVTDEGRKIDQRLDQHLEYASSLHDVP